MAGKKILIVLVIIAAAVTGYVLIRDAKTSVDNPQDLSDVQLNKPVEAKKVADNGSTSQVKPEATSAVDNQSAVTANPGTAATADAGGQTSTATTTNANVNANANNNSNNKIMKLEIKTTQAGTGDRVVKNGDKISVLYTGKFLDGTVFDASSLHGGKPFDFVVGQGNVIKGWDQGLLGAKVGEKRTLSIPSDLGYGAQGAGSSIPPNTDLIFDVELVSFK